MQKDFKVAFVTNDGKNIVGAFGSSKYFSVYTVNGGKVANQELREVYKDKVKEDVGTIKGNKIGGIGMISLNVHDPAKQKHMKMAKTIADCDIVVARKMCENAWDSVLQFKMRPIRTKNRDFDKSIQEILDGTIQSYEVS